MAIHFEDSTKEKKLDKFGVIFFQLEQEKGNLSERIIKIEVAITSDFASASEVWFTQ